MSDLPKGEAKRAAVRDMFDAIAPRYELVNRVLTLGMDVGWRRRTTSRLGLAPGSVVLDLAAGTGDLSRDLAALGHRPVAADLSLGMLERAGTDHARVQADAAALPFADAAFDGAVCGFALRNLVDLDAAFAELARVVRPAGRIGLLEVAAPENPVLRAGHAVYFGRVVPVVGGVLGRNRSAYGYLPRSVAYLPPVPDLLDSLRRAGFGAVRRDLLRPGAAQLITATREIDL